MGSNLAERSLKLLASHSVIRPSESRQELLGCQGLLSPLSQSEDYEASSQTPSEDEVHSQDKALQRASLIEGIVG